jgi:hypothetical protein
MPAGFPVGDTYHCMPQSTAEMNHHQYSTTTSFVPHTDILCSWTVSLSRCGTHRNHTLCYLPRSCTIVCSVSMLVFTSTDMEWVVQYLRFFTAFSTLVTFFRLMTMSACPSHGMSIVHCLPVPTYEANPPLLYFIHMQQYRRHICPRISADRHPSAERKWITAIGSFGWIQHMYTIFNPSAPELDI